MSLESPNVPVTATRVTRDTIFEMLGLRETQIIAKVQIKGTLAM